MMRRINWQREVGERRRRVEMVEGEEPGTREVLGAGKQMRESGKDGTRNKISTEQRKNELMGEERNNV